MSWNVKKEPINAERPNSLEKPSSLQICKFPLHRKVGSKMKTKWFNRWYNRNFQIRKFLLKKVTVGKKRKCWKRKDFLPYINAKDFLAFQLWSFCKKFEQSVL